MILTKVLSKETGNCESGTSKPCFTSVNESSLHEEVSTSSTEIQTDEESACEREQDGIGILTNEPFIVSFDAPHMASFSHSSKIPSLQSYDKQNTGGVDGSATPIQCHLLIPSPRAALWNTTIP